MFCFWLALMQGVMATTVSCKIKVVNNTYDYVQNKYYCQDNEIYLYLHGLKPSDPGVNYYYCFKDKILKKITASTKFSEMTTTLDKVVDQTILIKEPSQSCRLYFALKKNFDSIASFDPNTNPDPVFDSSVKLLFDKVEFDAQTVDGINMNTTNVDFVSIPFKFQATDKNTGQNVTYGWQYPRDVIFDAFEKIPDTPGDPANGNSKVFKDNLLQKDGSNFIRVVAPDKLAQSAWGADQSYFDDYWNDYINQCWTANRTLDLYDNNNVHYSGSIDGSGEMLTVIDAVNGNYTFNPKAVLGGVWPENSYGHIIFGGVGSYFYAVAGPIVNSAILRGVMHLDGKQWQNESLYYTGLNTSASPVHYYAKILHKYSYGSLCYALPYDDNNNWNPSVYIVNGGTFTVTINPFNSSRTQKSLTMAVIPGSSGTTFPVIGSNDVYIDTPYPVTAVPAAGYHFTGWTVSNCTVEDTKSESTYVTLSDTATLTANFATDTTPATLTMAVTGGGANATTFPAPGAGAGYFVGEIVKVQAAAEPGYHFTGWTVANATIESSGKTVTKVTLTGDATVTANFAADVTAATLTMAVSPAESGETYPNVATHSNYQIGESIPLVAVPAAGYHFTSWSVSGANAVVDDTSSDNTFMTLNANPSTTMTVTANFATNTYNLNYTAGANGFLTGGLSQAVFHGLDGASVTAVPNGGYKFVDWSDGVTTATRTDLTVVSHLDATANFAPSYALTVTNGTGDGDFIEGFNALISADSPAAGQHFLNWTTADGGTFADLYSPTTTYSMPGNSAEVIANYSIYSALISSEITKLVASDAAASDEFGYAVAISGDTAVVGAQRDGDGGSQTGSAYVFIKSGGAWTQQAKLTASDAGSLDNFGNAVAISGDTIVVGAVYDDNGFTDSGSAYVFTRSAGVWTQRAKLASEDLAASDFFGKSVSISGNTILVGASGNSFGGSAYVFTGSGATWTQQSKLTAADSELDDTFGNSVSLSGDTAVIGAHADDDAGTSSGSAYIFVRSGLSWTQQAKLNASDAAAGDQFGFSVAVSSDTVVVGARYDDDHGLSSGSAYIFSRTGTAWSQQAKLTASDGAANDQFGQAVSISNDTAIAGAPGDDDTADGSGSAYVFLRNGPSWTQQSKLTASDAAANDSFGYSVALHGSDVVSGALYDVGGGSAYTYELAKAHTITVNNGTGDGIYVESAVVPIVADAPATGYYFVNWTTGDGGSFGAAGASSTTYTIPGNDAAVTANYAIYTYTLTYNTGGNGSVTGINPQTVDYGSDGSQVTAVPDVGYHFVSWSDGVLTAARTDTDITADLTVSANFAINTYTLSYSAGTGGAITGTVTQSVDHGNDGTQVTAVADPGYHFEDWSDALLTPSRTDTNVTGDITVTANFTINPSHVLIVENGVGDGLFPEGYITPIVADSPAYGTIFKNWTTADGGVIADANAASTTYTIPANDATVTANFVTGYILTVNNGTGDGPYEPATVVNITADTPALGMKFNKWTGDVTNIANVNDAATTITMPAAATNITATYTVDETTALKITSGSVISVDATDISGADSEFISRPYVYGTYTDPVSQRDLSSALRAVSKISTSQPADRFKCEWSRSLVLYNKTDLRNSNKNGTSTKDWLIANTIDEVKTVLNLRSRKVNGTTIEGVYRGVQIMPPEITSVSRWDAGLPVGAFHTESRILINGNFFGSGLPTVGLEYPDAVTGAMKIQRLKVLRVYKYADAKGNAEKSCMDVDETSGTYGQSVIQVELPRSWWTGWAAGNFDIVLENKMGICTFQIATDGSGGNNPPVAKDDTFDLQTGDSSYYLDVLADNGNGVDTDADSDSMTIILPGTTSTLGGRIAVSKGQVRYSAPRGLTAPIADTFTYTLDDGHGGTSGAATVTVNFGAMVISSVEHWNGSALVDVQNGGLIVIKGQHFGIKVPTVTLNYSISGVPRTKRLKVQRLPKYADYRGKANSSYTDLTTGNSEISVEMPRTWWSGWTAGVYILEINNKIDSVTTNITTTATNTDPVANDDTETIFSGESYYIIYVLANDDDAESDKVKIILTSRTSNYGSRIAVDAKTNTVKYYRARDILCNFSNDTFTYYLQDSNGAVSGTATVTVSGSLNP